MQYENLDAIQLFYQIFFLRKYSLVISLEDSFNAKSQT